MADNTIIISGMFGADNTYFADNPVIISVSGLEFPQESPIKMVRVQVLTEDYASSDSSSSDSSSSDEPTYTTVGNFCGEVAGIGPYSITFDISSALRAIWADEDFSDEVGRAYRAQGSPRTESMRPQRPYFLKVVTEYIDSTDGEYTQTESPVYAAGSCILGGRTEWERSQITSDSQRDVSSLEHSNPRNGDASTKPRTTPERVGSMSITSWVDVSASGTKSIFYRYDQQPGEDDPDGRLPADQYTGHPPIVLRDTERYTDFLFVNRRGAVETCSGQMLEALDIAVETRQTTRVETPTYKPSRTIMSVATGGRRSWAMSSGYQPREWAEWWTLEFLMARRHWMRYQEKFVPVTVTPAKKATAIYDRTKQEMPSVEFTVTLGLEG